MQIQRELMQIQREHLQSFMIDFTDVNLMVWKVQSYLTKLKYMQSQRFKIWLNKFSSINMKKYDRK